MVHAESVTVVELLSLVATSEDADACPTHLGFLVACCLELILVLVLWQFGPEQLLAMDFECETGDCVE